MNINNRDWMYLRLNSDGYLSDEFINGVEQFIEFTFSNPLNVSRDKIKCPCMKCDNKKFQTRDDVTVHLYQKGFTKDYKIWYAQGEKHSLYTTTNQLVGQINELPSHSTYFDLVRDAFQPHVIAENSCRQPSPENFDESYTYNEEPNPEAAKFYSLLADVDHPLWTGCQKHSKLSAVAQLMNCKAEFNVSNACHERYLSIIKSMMPEDEQLAGDMYQTKKMMKKLGLTVVKIHVCEKNCMLFYKETSELVECTICGHPRFKPKINTGRKQKDVPFKVLRYLPLTPRLQRLFMSEKTAKDMIWHARNKKSDEMMHPSQGEAWNHFNVTHPEFAKEIRNVRLGLCTDGFNPFSQSAVPYTCWPVLIVVYNLPPWMCMKQSFILLTLIIPGPSSPSRTLDVFLRPLIDELKGLWDEGVLTFDSFRKQNFQLRAALMWTVSDFPAYAMLSGWSTHGRLSCPYCMERSKAFYLTHSGKICFFDCHRQFLPSDHPYRKQRNKFTKGRTDFDTPPPRPTGDQLLHKLTTLSVQPPGKSTRKYTFSGFGKDHNWTKKSIFWELSYWRTHLIRHNLDVMHIEKNVFDNIFNTIFDVKEKTKDNIKARLDLADICRRPELELILTEDKYLKPEAAYVLTKTQVKDVCEWVKDLRFPDGYVSNISKCVNMKDYKFYGMKTHDSHVFMQRLLPIIVRDYFPKPIADAIIELSQFFKHICATTLNVEHLKIMEVNIVDTICKLEKIFPPSFFDSMEHLVIHLAYEASVGGPVQYRWMYPFERTMHHLKQKVRNKANIEGSICEAFVIEEISTFCSMYFESSVSSKWNQVPKNDDDDYMRTKNGPLSLFNHPGRPQQKCGIRRRLNDKEFEAVRIYVLMNCSEITPYLRKYEEQNPSVSLKGMHNKEFADWLREELATNIEKNRYILELVRGPLRFVKTYSGYYINGYKFHTVDFGFGKKIMNSGIIVKGSEVDNPEDDFYGLLKEILEVDYLGYKVMLFKVEWFDSSKRGLQVDQHGLIQIRHTSRLPIYEPFILATQAQQIYYVPSASKQPNKMEWWTVYKIVARDSYNVSDKNELENKYLQEESTIRHEIIVPCSELDNIESLLQPEEIEIAE